MIDLSYHKPKKHEECQPEEIVIAIIASMIWAMMAFVIGGAL